MEKIVEFSQYQKATSGDLTNQGKYARDSLDHVVSDGIVGGVRGYIGFATVATGQTKVTTGTGRLYNVEGSVFFRDDTGGVVTDFLNQLPAVAQRYATIVVAAPPAQDTATQSREFLVDVVARTTQAKAVPTESWRQATVSVVLGSESATPLPPALDAQYLGICNVLLSPTGIVSVSMIVGNQLPSVQTVNNGVKVVQNQLNVLAPKLATIESEITQITNTINKQGQNDYMLRMAADVALLKAQANLPANYSDYASDIFLNANLSNTSAAGYLAQIDDGLRFPIAATATSTLVLANPIDATVSQSNGLILPAYDEYRWREIAPNQGRLALNQFAYTTNTLTVANMAASRAQFGDYFTVSASSSWWLSTSSYDPITGKLRKDGQLFEAIPTGELDPNGALIFRARSISSTNASTPYWTRTKGSVTAAGYPWVQTFLMSQTVWCTSIGVPFAILDSSGPVTFGLCEIREDGTPNFDKVLTTTTVPVNQLWLDGRDPNPFRRYQIQPTLLEAGKRYGLMVITAGNHWVIVSNAADYQNGTLFYQNNSGYWQNDPTHNFLFDLGIAGFRSTRTEVVFNNNALTLGGGISILDILAPAIAPKSTSITWQVLVNGVWSSFDPAKASPLASLPASIGLKAIFNGTNGIQPGLNIAQSQVKVQRPATALKHVSTPQTLAAASTNVRLIVNLENFDSAKHTATLGIRVGATDYVPATVTDRVLPSGVLQRTANFSGLPAGTTQIVRTITGTSTDTNALFTANQITHVSF